MYAHIDIRELGLKYYALVVTTAYARVRVRIKRFEHRVSPSEKLLSPNVIIKMCFVD